MNIAAHAAFVPVGIVTVLLGPLLPILSARWSLNYSQAGSLFTAQFLGATVGVVISGVMVSRWGYWFAINAGLLAMAAGVGTLAFSSRSLGLVCIACYGIGLGFAIPAINLLVAEINPERRSAALNLLNFSWSVGAVACPFIVAAAAKIDRIQLFLAALAGFLLLVLLGIAAMPSSFAEPGKLESFPVETAPVRKDGRPDVPQEPAVPLPPWNHRSLVVMSALFFLYVGTENGFGGWIASYAKSLGTSSSTLPVMTPSFFYAAIMLGRWMAPLVLRKADEIKTARAGLSIACIGMAGLVLSRNMPLVVISAAVAGLGLAAVYPITISRLSQEFGPAAARAGSVVFTMCNFGGAFLPWVVGYTSQQFKDLRAGLGVPLAATVLMYILYQRSWAPSGATAAGLAR
jgi:FHS family glucose/mannose:H+ symporter-like MFS transporter